jgi:hypothetical protein
MVFTFETYTYIPTSRWQLILAHLPSSSGSMAVSTIATRSQPRKEHHTRAGCPECLIWFFPGGQDLQRDKLQAKVAAKRGFTRRTHSVSVSRAQRGSNSTVFKLS